MQRIYLALVVAVLFTSTLFSQKIVGTINGTDAPDGLAGAAIQVVGTNTGTVTDLDGRFTLGLPAYGTYALRISSLGYRAQEVTVALDPAQPIASFSLDLSPGAFSLEELTISATRATEKTPVTYVNLDREELAKQNLGQDLPFMLKWTPSVVVTSDAGAGVGYTGIWIRGSDPTRTNVTINGIPFNDSESQGTFWVNLPDFVSSAEEIQVQRGVGTSTNGAGAFGATININTNEIKEEAYGSIDAGIGSYNTQRGTVRFGTGQLKNGFSLDGRASRITSDGYIDRASSELNGYYLSAAKTGEKSILRFNLFGGDEITYQAWYGVPADLVDDRVTRRTNLAGTEKEGEPYDREVDDYGQTHAQLHYSLDLGKNLGLSLSGHYTKGAGYFEQYKADESLADYGIMAISPGNDTILDSDLIRRRWLDNDFYGLVYSLRYGSTDGKTDLTLGGGYHRYLGDHYGEVIWARYAGNSEIRDLYYDNEATKNDFNIFTKLNRELSPGLNAYVDLQLRAVNYSFLGIDENGSPLNQEVSHTFFNPKAGLFYQFNPRAEAYASFGVAQREPNRNDFVDNPAANQPVPEKLYNTEIGYRWLGQRANFGANVYHMLYRDQLVLTGELNDVGASTRINVPKSYRLGLELQAGYAPMPRLTLAGNLTISRNRISSYTEFLDDYDQNFDFIGQVSIEREDTPIAFSPDILGGGEVAYQILNGRHQLTATLLGKYVGRRYLDNSGDETNSIDPYFYADGRLQYVVDAPGFARIRINFQVNNLFDELYSANGWSYRYQFNGQPALDQGLYPQATRNFLLGLGLDF